MGNVETQGVSPSVRVPFLRLELIVTGCVISKKKVVADIVRMESRFLH
jgi:hypothetical protein